MSNAEKRTRGDWAAYPSSIEGRCDIYTNESEGMIAQNVRPEDGAFIVKAHASYDSDQAKIKALVEALEFSAWYSQHPGQACIVGGKELNRTQQREHLGDLALSALSLVKGE